jgi:hypothetical protein
MTTTSTFHISHRRSTRKTDGAKKDFFFLYPGFHRTGRRKNGFSLLRSAISTGPQPRKDFPSPQKPRPVDPSAKNFSSPDARAGDYPTNGRSSATPANGMHRTGWRMEGPRHRTPRSLFILGCTHSGFRGIDSEVFSHFLLFFLFGLSPRIPFPLLGWGGLTPFLFYMS